MTEPATSPSPWTVTLDGVTIPLTPTIASLIAIERDTGRTLLQLADAVSTRSVTLTQLATIIRSFAGPQSPLEAARASEAYYLWRTPMMSAGDDPLCGLIISNGMVDVLASGMTPLVAAVMGKTDAEGRLRLASEAA